MFLEYLSNIHGLFQCLVSTVSPSGAKSKRHGQAHRGASGRATPAGAPRPMRAHGTVWDARSGHLPPRNGKAGRDSDRRVAPDVVGRRSKDQMACKPGSVSAFAVRLGRAMAIHLGRPLPDASCNQPGRRPGNGARGCPPVVPIRSCSRWGLPCHPCHQGRGALLPHPFTLTRRCAGARGQAVCFLWHFPWSRLRRGLPGTVFPWSPDFPPPARTPAAAIRPSGPGSM